MNLFLRERNNSIIQLIMAPLKSVLMHLFFLVYQKRVIWVGVKFGLALLKRITSLKRITLLKRVAPLKRNSLITKKKNMSLRQVQTHMQIQVGL